MHRFVHQGGRAWAYRLVRVAAAADVVFVLGMVATILSTVAQTSALDGSNDWVFRLFQLFGLLGLTGVLLGPWNAVQVWRDGTSSWWAKLTAVLATVAFFAIAYLAFTIPLLTATLSY
jgi:hypothetical protein